MYKHKESGVLVNAEKVTDKTPASERTWAGLVLDPGYWKVTTASGQPWGYAPSDAKFKEEFTQQKKEKELPAEGQ